MAFQPDAFQSDAFQSQPTRNLSDTVTTTDDVAARLDFTRAVDDTVPASDTLNHAINGTGFAHNLAATDTVVVGADDPARQVAALSALDDTTSVTDDLVRAYGQSRTAVDGGTSFAALVAALSPSAYYRFGEGGPATTIRATVGADLTTVVGTAYTPGGLASPDGARALGSGDYMQRADDASLDLGDGPFSIVAFVRRDGTGSTDRIVYKGNGAYSLLIDSVGRIVLDQPFVGQAARSSAGFEVTDSNWHLVAAVRTGGTTSLYLDGVKDPSPTLTARTLTDNSIAFTVGKDGDFSGGEWVGALDEIALFKTALSDGNITALWNATMVSSTEEVLRSTVTAFPSFVAASAGVATTATGTWSLVIPASAAVGDILVAQIMRDSTTGTAPSISGWTLKHTDDTGGSLIQQWVYWKRCVAGEPGATRTVTADGTSALKMGRIYAFRNARQTGDPFGDTNLQASFLTSSNTVLAPTLTSTYARALALAFVAGSDDQALDAFAGETGGNWIEPVAEFVTTTGSDGMIAVQTATLSAPGTITGGSDATAGSTQWVSRGLILRPIAAAGEIEDTVTTGAGTVFRSVARTRTPADSVPIGLDTLGDIDRSVADSVAGMSDYVVTKIVRGISGLPVGPTPPPWDPADGPPPPPGYYEGSHPAYLGLAEAKSVSGKVMGSSGLGFTPLSAARARVFGAVDEASSSGGYVTLPDRKAISGNTGDLSGGITDHFDRVTGNGTSFDNTFEVLLKFRFRMGVTTQRHSCQWIMDSTTGTFIQMIIENNLGGGFSNQMGIRTLLFADHVGGSTSLDQPVHGILTTVDDVWCWARMRIENGQAMARLWKDGDAEPSTWPAVTADAPTQFDGSHLNLLDIHWNGGASGSGSSLEVESFEFPVGWNWPVSAETFTRTVALGAGISELNGRPFLGRTAGISVNGAALVDTNSLSGSGLGWQLNMGPGGENWGLGPLGQWHNLSTFTEYMQGQPDPTAADAPAWVDGSHGSMTYGPNSDDPTQGLFLTSPAITDPGSVGSLSLPLDIEWRAEWSAGAPDCYLQMYLGPAHHYDLNAWIGMTVLMYTAGYYAIEVDVGGQNWVEWPVADDEMFGSIWDAPVAASITEPQTHGVLVKAHVDQQGFFAKAWIDDGRAEPGDWMLKVYWDPGHPNYLRVADYIRVLFFEEQVDSEIPRLDWLRIGGTEGNVIKGRVDLPGE